MYSLDANVLVYAFDVAAGPSHERALDVLARSRFGDCQLSLQVIGEFFVASLRTRPGERAVLAAHADDLTRTFPCLMPTAAAVRAALRSAAVRRLHYWDALLLATLREAGCSVLLSEDTQHGADHDGLRVLNPFIGGALPNEIEALLA